MRSRKIKRKNKLYLLKSFVLFIVFFSLFFSSYFYFFNFLNIKLISPLGSKIQNSDKDDIERKLSSAGLSYSSVSVASDSSYILTLPEGGKAIITPQKNINEQISSLQLVLNRLTIEGKRIKVIDFRYDKPVIRL